MKNLIFTLLCSLFALTLSAHNIIPQPKQIKYLSDKQVKLKSVDIKVIPTKGEPSEKYTLTIRGGKAIIIAHLGIEQQHYCWGE